MSTKMSKEDLIKALKSKGLLSEEELSKINGGVFYSEPVTIQVACPWCNNVEGNVLETMPGGGKNTGLVTCKECEELFYVKDGKVVLFGK